MADPTNALFSAFAFIGFIITLIPLPWHLEAWNSGTCYFMIWTSLGCLNQFINSIIWRGNALNSAPVWCDISTRLTLGVSVAIPAASLCINRRLYQIAKIHAVVVTRADKRRAIFIDSILCFLIPVLVMALYYVVQGHRFDIFEDVGCYPVVYDTLLSYFLINMWPLIFGLVSAVYCSLSIYSFSKRRASFNEFMTSNKSITVSRYFRLMALAMTDLLCTVPFALYSIWLNASVGVQKWVSWSDTHFDFSRVDQFPSVLWHLDQRTVVSIELTRWLLPVCAILFFLYFGFASEARRHYRVFFYVIAKPFGIKPPTKKPSGSAAGYVRPKPPPPSSFGSSFSTLPTPPTPPSKESRAISLAPSFTETEFSAGSMEKLALSPPPFPPLAMTRDSLSPLSMTSSLPSSPTHTMYTLFSDCPTIDRLPFETDPSPILSLPDTYPISAPTSPSVDDHEPLPAHPPAPAFHRPFSPPTVYPSALPHSVLRREASVTLTVRTEVENIV